MAKLEASARMLSALRHEIPMLSGEMFGTVQCLSFAASLTSSRH